jgi:hypothetical protein
VSSETPVASSWSRALSVPMFGAAALFALLSMLAFNDAFHEMRTRLFIMALGMGVAAIILGGLGISLAQGRGVPNWFMRTFLISLLPVMLVAVSLDILFRWQQGIPIEFGDMAFYLMILIVCFPDGSWKALWFHRSIET